MSSTSPDFVTPTHEVTNETKPATKTSEFAAYVVAVVAVLVASGIIDGFDAARAWLFVTILTVGYMTSRGLAKSGRAYHAYQR